MTTSTKPGTREVVQAAYDALSSGDAATFLGLLADDVTLHEPDNHPAPGLLRNKQEVVDALEGLVAGLGLRGLVVLRSSPRGKRAVGIIDVECTAGSGREYTMSVVEVWTVRHGPSTASTPRISAVTLTGTYAAKSPVKSNSRPPEALPASMASSSRPRITVSIRGCILRITDGMNARLASRRSRVWSGGSRAMMLGTSGTGSNSPNALRMKPRAENWSGCRKVWAQSS